MAGVAPFQRAERELTVWQAGVHEAIAGAPELGAETAAGAEHGAEADAGVEQGAQHLQMTGIYARGGHSHQLPYGGVPLYRVDFERPVSLK